MNRLPSVLLGIAGLLWTALSPPAFAETQFSCDIQPNPASSADGSAALTVEVGNIGTETASDVIVSLVSSDLLDLPVPLIEGGSASLGTLAPAQIGAFTITQTQPLIVSIFTCLIEYRDATGLKRSQVVFPEGEGE